MAVPTISTVTPNNGPPCGKNLVIITGTNFRTPTITYTIPATAVPQTVSVTIAGLAADRVEVASSTKLYVIVPEAEGNYKDQKFDPVDIVITNLDDDGNPISGESVTLTDGYTYKRWEFSAAPLIAVAKKFLTRLMREVHPNVGWNTHPEFIEETVGTVTLVSEAPSINVDMDVEDDMDYNEFDNGFADISDGTITMRYRALRSRRFEARVMIVGRNKTEAFHMADAIENSFMINPFIKISADASLYSGNIDTFPVELRGSVKRASNPNNMGTYVLMHQLWIRGIRTLASIPVDWYKPILEDEMTIHLSDVDGNNREETSV